MYKSVFVHEIQKRNLFSAKKSQFGCPRFDIQGTEQIKELSYCGF